MKDTYATTKFRDNSAVSRKKEEIAIQRKLEDPENVLRTLNALKTNILMHSYQLEMVEETLEASVDLVKKIDNYLGLTPDMVNHYD